MRAHEPPTRPRKTDAAAAPDGAGAVAFKAAILKVRRDATLPCAMCRLRFGVRIARRGARGGGADVLIPCRLTQGLETKLRLKLGLLGFAHNRAEALDRARLTEHLIARADAEFPRKVLRALAEAVDARRVHEGKAEAAAEARRSRWTARALPASFEAWRAAAARIAWTSRQLRKGLVRYRRTLLKGALAHWVVAVRSARLSRLQVSSDGRRHPEWTYDTRTPRRPCPATLAPLTPPSRPCTSPAPSQGAAAAAWECLWIKRRAMAGWRNCTITARTIKASLQQQENGKGTSPPLSLPTCPGSATLPKERRSLHPLSVVLLLSVSFFPRSGRSSWAPLAPAKADGSSGPRAPP